MKPNGARLPCRLRLALITPWLVVFCSLTHAENDNDFSAALQKIRDKPLQECLKKTQEKQQWSSVSDVDKLKCHSKNIERLDGIEQFTSLKELSLFNNNIKSFQFFKLPNLLKLNVAKNPLTEFQLSHAKLLELFIFSTNTETLELELPSAILIRANNNRLTRFHHQKLRNLSKLYLFNNNLPTLDISGLDSLQFLDVRQNPMPDELYDRMDRLLNVTVFHDGNAEDWQ